MSHQGRVRHPQPCPACSSFSLRRWNWMGKTNTRDNKHLETDTYRHRFVWGGLVICVFLLVFCLFFGVRLRVALSIRKNLGKCWMKIQSVLSVPLHLASEITTWPDSAATSPLIVCYWLYVSVSMFWDKVLCSPGCLRLCT